MKSNKIQRDKARVMPKVLKYPITYKSEVEQEELKARFKYLLERDNSGKHILLEDAPAKSKTLFLKPKRRFAKDLSERIKQLRFANGLLNNYNTILNELSRVK